MKEAFAGSDYDHLREQIELLRKELEELKADRSSKPFSARWRRFARRRSWAWLRVSAAVLLALGLLGAQNKQDALYIKSNGNVGINRTDPEKTLDVNGDAVIRGQLQARGVTPASPALPAGSGVVVGDSDIYFTGTTHSHTGQGNQQGLAAIENDGKTYNALMILGRNRTAACCNRVVSVVDKLGIQTHDPQATLDVNGNTIVRNDTTIQGNLSVAGRADLGIYQKWRTDCGTDLCDIACDSGDVAISGGAYIQPPGALRESRPISQNTWRVACVIVGIGASNKQCAEARVVCAKHAK